MFKPLKDSFHFNSLLHVAKTSMSDLPNDRTDPSISKGFSFLLFSFVRKDFLENLKCYVTWTTKCSFLLISNTAHALDSIIDSSFQPMLGRNPRFKILKLQICDKNLADAFFFVRQGITTVRFVRFKRVKDLISINKKELYINKK